MRDQFWLTPAQLNRIKPHFPLSHGVPRVDDLRVVSGIIHVIKRDLQWRDAPYNATKFGIWRGGRVAGKF